MNLILFILMLTAPQQADCFHNGQEHEHQWPLSARPIVVVATSECELTWSDDRTTNNKMLFSKMFRASACRETGDSNECAAVRKSSIKKGSQGLVLYCEECRTAITFTYARR